MLLKNEHYKTEAITQLLKECFSSMSEPLDCLQLYIDCVFIHLL